MQQYVEKLKKTNPATVIRLSNDAWGVVLLMIMFSFLQYAIANVTNMTNLLQYCLMMTMLTILIISFFSNPNRDVSRFVSSNIVFIAIFIAFISTGIEFDLIIIVIGFFALLWVYFLLCMQFPEIEENPINIRQMILVAIVQITLYSVIALSAVGLPTL